MSYYQAAACDFRALSIKQLYLRMNTFNKVHADEQKFRVRLASHGKLG